MRIPVRPPQTVNPEFVLQSGHANDVASVAFSPDGRQVLTGSSDNTAKLRDADSGRQLSTLQGHSSVVTSVAFSPNGRQVVTRRLAGD
ncbi:MAG: hypothetical protein KDA37_02270 [Planctomycetales bacterium]|nr:hypothetical protein [Planctomycetales bacterium]